MIRTRSLFYSLTILSLITFLAPKKVSAQLYAIKTNIPALLTTNLNVAFEISISKKFSLELPIYANPWTYSDRYSALFAVAQPGARYWIYECFTGPFIGAHTGFGLGQLQFKGTTYRGYLGSVGASFGYAWMLGVRWNLEAEVGAGYYLLNYKTKGYNATKWTNRKQKNIFAPTRLGLNIVYLF